MIENIDRVPKYRGLITNFVFMFIGILMIIIPITVPIESDFKYAILMVGILIGPHSIDFNSFFSWKKKQI